MTESQSIDAIEEILHEHEGDGHDHGAVKLKKLNTSYMKLKMGTLNRRFRRNSSLSFW